jgi:chemotaxis protein CheD
MTHTRPKGVAPAEIHLNPGDFYFGDGNVRLHTLLGSCVAITLWHPVFRFGGMCHFMLPNRNRQESEPLNGRYGDEAMQLFLTEISRFNTRPGEYQAKIFGGGNMFHALKGGKPSEVAGRNITLARAALHAAGFELCAEDVGGNGHRRIIFNLNDGNVWVRHEKKQVVNAA